MRSECDEFRKNIPGFLLGDLAAEELRALEAHLAICADCRSERENYIRTLDLMQSVDDEPVPHHFFIHPQEEVRNPWQLFSLMKPVWKASVAAAATLFLLVGIAAISRLQIRSDSNGWVVSFSSNVIDVAALKEDILKTAGERNTQATAAQTQRVRDDLEGSFADLSKDQREEFMAALAQMDSRFAGRLDTTEAEIKEDTQKLVSEIYQAVNRQRARDLEVINLRFDSFEMNSAIKDRQTNAVLDTLVQVAELSLRETGGQ
jgi:hypothetical protein